MQTFMHWINIFGFAFAVVTLLTTLNIHGKIDRSLGKQRFLQQRDKIVAEFTDLRRRAAGAAEGGDAMDAILLDLRGLALQLSHFRIWRWQDRRTLRAFIRYVSQAYLPDKPGEKASCKALIMRVEEIVAMVKAQAEV